MYCSKLLTFGRIGCKWQVVTDKFKVVGKVADMVSQTCLCKFVQILGLRSHAKAKTFYMVK